MLDLKNTLPHWYLWYHHRKVGLVSKYRAFPDVWRSATEQIFKSHLDSSQGKSKQFFCLDLPTTVASKDRLFQTWALLTLLYICPAGVIPLLFCASVVNLGESNSFSVTFNVLKLHITITALLFLAGLSSPYVTTMSSKSKWASVPFT